MLISALFCLIVQCVGGNWISNALSTSLHQTLFEQEVEDINSVHKIDNHIVRRLIVMPLTDIFKPNQADLMHGKIQFGDKCSMPTSIGRLIFEKRYEVPWIFEMKPVKDAEKFKLIRKTVKLAKTLQEREESNVEEKKPYSKPILNKVYFSPLDFRSPENYIFLPEWMMTELSLSPNDVVDVSMVRIKLAGLVVFQPLTLNWDELIEKGNDPKTILEHELNKYSSLTAGSTIYIEVNGTKYPLFVKDTYAEGGVRVRAVRVQDSDVNTDIDRSVLDALKRDKEDKKLVE